MPFPPAHLLRRRGATLLAILLWGCSPSVDAGEGRGEDGAFGVVLADDLGQTVRLASPAVRILSLVPSATEILVALGVRDRIVGRTDFDLDPDLAPLPSVGGGLEPSMEQIVILRPDLVIHFAASSDPTTPQRLDAAGIPRLALRPDRIEDVLRGIALLGQASGEQGRALALADSLRAELAILALRIEEETEPRRVAYLLGGDPAWVVGGGTFLDDLIQLAGGVNHFASLSTLYAPVSTEALLDPSIELFILSEGRPLPEALRGRPVLELPPSAEIPGLGMGRTALLLARGMHPEAFP